MATSTFTVVGMTCGCCANKVRDEIARIDGVGTVDVDVESGAVGVTSAVPVPADQVKVAVETAGYQLV
ncbi:heavy-metal-associated domain-containing protein [Jiangella asiatica]|uniref:Copper chaperone n=1 Tax=Jiangella asiatica TaxID=2530372 RepID=A0A4R5DG65_9ACTN|nr:heavy-metal-associated domain-containing protein [Jiangella asiatica]TDE12187.1 copper chaperone [Jiangella asiatica]